MAAYLSFVQVLTAGAIAAIVELGGRQAIDGAVAPGVVIAFIVYLRTALGPLPSVASLHSLVSQASSGLDRIAALLEHPAEVPDPPAARDLGHVSGEIRFEKAWFAYSDERWVLRSLNLTVRAGETLAIVGTTGAGKSTLVKLLLRFYDPARGRILITASS